MDDPVPKTAIGPSSTAAQLFCCMVACRYCTELGGRSCSISGGSNARYLLVDLARLVLSAGQSKHRPNRLGLSEADGHVNCGPIGQRHSRADTGDRHQTPAHIIVSDDGQQAAVQYAKLRAKDLPDNEQRLDQLGHIGQVLDQPPDTRLELDRSHDPCLETEVSQRATEVIVEGNGLRLHKLAMGQKHPQLLTA